MGKQGDTFANDSRRAGSSLEFSLSDEKEPAEVGSFAACRKASFPLVAPSPLGRRRPIRDHPAPFAVELVSAVGRATNCDNSANSIHLAASRKRPIRLSTRWPKKLGPSPLWPPFATLSCVTNATRNPRPTLPGRGFFGVPHRIGAIVRQRTQAGHSRSIQGSPKAGAKTAPDECFGLGEKRSFDQRAFMRRRLHRFVAQRSRMTGITPGPS